MIKSALIAVATLLMTMPVVAADISSSVEAASVSERRSTPLGLYLTPEDAHKALINDPSIVFIDVRDPIEIAFVGHADGVDAIVPLRLATHDFNAEAGTYRERENPDFLAQAEAVIARAGGGKATPVFVICRSGGRSAVAARRLAEAGYTNVWNLIEGFEGDKNDAGARAVNGWRNAGLPWGYKIAAEVAWTPPE